VKYLFNRIKRTDYKTAFWKIRQAYFHYLNYFKLATERRIPAVLNYQVKELKSIVILYKKLLSVRQALGIKHCKPVKENIVTLYSALLPFVLI
jgi:hypothetical protein